MAKPEHLTTIDGNLAQSYKIGTVVTIGEKNYKPVKKDGLIVWERDELSSESVEVDKERRPKADPESDTDSETKGDLEDKTNDKQEKTKEPVDKAVTFKEHETSIDDVLDEFKPEEYTFFCIGDKLGCQPCKRSKIIIDKYSDLVEGVTVKEWTYSLKSKEVVGPGRDMKNKWIAREHTKNNKFRDYHTIPMIWVKGDFIGGEMDLIDYVSQHPDWNDE